MLSINVCLLAAIRVGLFINGYEPILNVWYVNTFVCWYFPCGMNFLATSRYDILYNNRPSCRNIMKKHRHATTRDWFISQLFKISAENNCINIITKTSSCKNHLSFIYLTTVHHVDHNNILYKLYNTDLNPQRPEEVTQISVGAVVHQQTYIRPNSTWRNHTDNVRVAPQRPH